MLWDRKKKLYFKVKSSKSNVRRENSFCDFVIQSEHEVSITFHHLVILLEISEKLVNVNKFIAKRATALVSVTEYSQMGIQIRNDNN